MAGISGKVRIEGEDEEGIYTEAQGKAIIEALGLERRNEVRLTVFKELIVLCSVQYSGQTNSTSRLFLELLHTQRLWDVVLHMAGMAGCS